MSIFDKIKDAFLNSETEGNNREFEDIINSSRAIQLKSGPYFYGIKVNTFSTYNDIVLKWDDRKKIDFIIFCVEQIPKNNLKRTTLSSDDIFYQNNYICEGFVDHLLKTKLAIDENNFSQLVQTFSTNKKWETSVMQWPVALLLTQVERQYKNKEITNGIIESLNKIKQQIQSPEAGAEKERIKLIERIDSLLFKAQNGGEVKPVLFLGNDQFTSYANSLIETFSTEDKKVWYRLMEKAQKASGSKPSQKYLNETKELYKSIKSDGFKKTVNEWFNFLANLKDNVTEHTTVYQNRPYVYTSTEYISSINTEAIKGFVWICSHFHDNTTLNNIARLAERSYKKIPGKGPAAAGMGNACLYTLYSSKGLDGIGLLSRLKLRIKQNNTQSIIEKYIQSAAEKEGVSTHEIEDMAVENFNLIAGEREYEFDEYKCKLKITSIGKSELSWYKPDGSLQKSIPVFIKEKFAAKLKKIKETQKQLDLTTSAQRDRIDRMFRAYRKINIENFQKFYLDHGLMSFLSSKLIWAFSHGDTEVSAIKINDQWITNENQIVQPKKYDHALLWHPASHKLSEVKKWRDFLIERQIQQPLKQAFREVYILTDAEINTKTYSNRMAAHVLKQHQFNVLAKTRGWKYSLLGAYDDGRSNETASVTLPEFGLRAEYWVNELNADNEFNDSGIWNYITTDQVRFVDISSNNPVDLVDVPAIPFSEILRDVDLFVGVGSVGNDPVWRDSGGVPAYRDYWTSYSFGDLSEVAKNRKEILSGLIPRLKINKISEIKDKFLVVKGKLRTYKIHLGSTNILMEPNDQYLCIVPDRSKKNHTENLFIPFEGDAGMSVILSKAFLLAEDDKITDPTITSQINRK